MSSLLRRLVAVVALAVGLGLAGASTQAASAATVQPHASSGNHASAAPSDWWF